MSNIQVGKVYEKRGDDHFTVVTTPNGEVVQIIQRDSIRLTYPSIDFFAESAPELIRLIAKAAKLDVEIKG